MSKISHGWYGPSVEARIAAHVQAWQKSRELGRPRPPETYPFVTISREFGCEAVPLAHQLVNDLNKRFLPNIPWVAYDHEVLDRVAQELHLAREVVESLDNRRRDEISELFDAILNRKVDEAVIFRKMAEVIRSIAIHGHAVIVGRGSHMLTHDLKTGLHVRLVAHREWRIQKVAQAHGMTLRDAEKYIVQGEKERDHFVHTFFVQDREHPFNFDSTIDNSRFDVAQIAEVALAALQARFGQSLLAA
jgi:cytidylate kinase